MPTPITTTFFSSREEAEADPLIQESLCRGFIEVKNNRITYILANKRSEDWADPEEWVRGHTVAFLVLTKDYPPNRIKTEVTVPRRTPHDLADIVVYSDDTCRTPYLVIESKRARLPSTERDQAIEQLFGNANSLRAPWGLFDSGDDSIVFDVGNFPSMERSSNQLGPRDRLAPQYGAQPRYAHVVGAPGDIRPRAAIGDRKQNSLRPLAHLVGRETRSPACVR